jgi:hypothetical protein
LAKNHTPWRVEPGGFLAINALAAGLCWLSRHVSLGSLPWLLGGDNLVKRQWLLHVYVLGWLLALGVFLFVLPGDGSLGIGPFQIPLVWLIPFVAFYRLQDLLFASLDDALGITGIFPKVNPLARVLILFVNVAQLVLIFAIAYRYILGSTLDTATGRLSAFASGPSVHIRFDYLFLSWNSLPPLGNGYQAEDLPARLLTMAETGTALLLIVMALSAFVAKSDD